MTYLNLFRPSSVQTSTNQIPEIMVKFYLNKIEKTFKSHEPMFYSQ